MIIALPLIISIIAGAWNGVLVGFVGVPPIVATLILMVAGRGIAQLLTNGQITFHHESFAYIARGGFLGLPFPITLVVFAIHRPAGRDPKNRRRPLHRRAPATTNSPVAALAGTRAA